MNEKLKSTAKKIIYPTMDILDVVLPSLSTLLTHYFYHHRTVINDLHISTPLPYHSLGVYPTLYSVPPSHKWYRRFLALFHFDEQGVPQTLDKACNTLYHNPVMIAQYGIAEYGYYMSTNDRQYRENCLRAAQGLLRFQDKQGGFPYWIEYASSRGVALKSGWYSAMAQGQAISLFVRANALEPDPAYQKAAHQALALLEVPVSEGGLLSKLGEHDFFEEYPSTPPSFTLNGFLFCLFGLYDGSRVFQDEQANRLFQNGVQTVRAALPLYDGDGLSSYDLVHVTHPPLDRLRDRKYHILHVKLLQALDSIQHDDIFTFYIQKWGKHWR